MDYTSKSKNNNFEIECIDNIERKKDIDSNYTKLKTVLGNLEIRLVEITAVWIC